ncbi:MAG: hypothetical protein GXO19_07040 [Epsilonproteobacteria bacterium]|nr:hypothetical protein [Campylobacterota bacterium]
MEELEEELLELEELEEELLLELEELLLELEGGGLSHISSQSSAATSTIGVTESPPLSVRGRERSWTSRKAIVAKKSLTILYPFSILI